MLTGAYLYPWDVDGDPAAADRIAGLGLTEITLAAAYHAVRAVTPAHPRHRIVTRDAAVYYRADPARWAGRLRPPAADPPAADPPAADAPGADPPAPEARAAGAAGSFERAAAALRAAGIRVTAWVVVTHNSRLAASGECAVRNAFGDVYPWALCAGSPDVRGYAAALAAEVAALAGVEAIELEACGWYGFEHGSAHDKTGGVAGPAGPAGAGGDWLLSLCFCPACAQAYRAAGADPARLAAQVRAAADGGPALPGDAAALLDQVRGAAAGGLLTDVLTAVRAAAPGQPVLVHAAPDPRAVGANPGYDPAVLCGPGGADGVVLSCGNPATAAGLVARTAAAAPPGARIAAVLQAVAGLGGHPETLPAQAAAVRAAGATELRLYHAGLAAPGDLAAIRDFCRPASPAPFPALPSAVGAVAGQLGPEPGDVVLVVMVLAVLADASVSLEPGAGAFGARPRSGPRWPVLRPDRHGAAVPLSRRAPAGRPHPGGLLTCSPVDGRPARRGGCQEWRLSGRKVRAAYPGPGAVPGR